MAKSNLPAAPEFKAPSKAVLAKREQRVGQGSENVSANDMAIPRIKLLQKINDEVDPTKGDYVEGAVAGQFFNTVTKELSTAILCVNLAFTSSVIVWKGRKFGGGKIAEFDTKQEAEQYLADNNLPVEQYDVQESPSHLVMLLDNEGNPKGAARIDMPSTKVKVSKVWNSRINELEQEGHPRFGCVWKIGNKIEENNSGSYFNYDIDFVVVAGDELYEPAAAIYDSFQ